MVVIRKISVATTLLIMASLSFAQAKTPRHAVILQSTLGACSFRLADTLGGRLEDNSHGDPPTSVYEVELHRSTLPNAFSIDFACQSENPVQACRDFAGADLRSGHWVSWQVAGEPPLPPQAYEVITGLTGDNWYGAVHIWNDVGPALAHFPNTRHLSFCLIAPNGATLFGKAPIDVLQSSHHRSVEPEVTQLLRTIGFIGPSAEPVRKTTPTY